MSYYPKKDWKLCGFERSHLANKKYNAVLLNLKKGNIKTLGFGDTRYQQYKDSTGLGFYSRLDHRDKQRRKQYLQRHVNDINKPYSASYFSKKYLW
jgi:hypothetical protein